MPAIDIVKEWHMKYECFPEKLNGLLFFAIRSHSFSWLGVFHEHYIKPYDIIIKLNQNYYEIIIDIIMYIKPLNFSYDFAKLVTKPPNFKLSCVLVLQWGI